ncbi:phage tail assembly protein [Phormidium tenue FACHB-886]|nr:phage tail assembly protein [Phormidium tenue FACHB-886]
MSRQLKLQTEFPFTLPQGLIDDQNRQHRHGFMRLATARDELLVQGNLKVRENPAYGFLVMLSQVICRLGSLNAVKPALLEKLTIRDLAYLREYYNRLNQQGDVHIPAECPRCQEQFAVELLLAGEP